MATEHNFEIKRLHRKFSPYNNKFELCWMADKKESTMELNQFSLYFETEADAMHAKEALKKCIGLDQWL